MYKLLIVSAMCGLFFCQCNQPENTMNAGLSLADMDTTAHPGTDFYQYANGGWMAANPLRKEYARFGTFDKLQEQNLEMLRTLIVGLVDKNPDTASEEGKIARFYKAGMDTAAIEKAGLEPVKPLLEKISQATDAAELMEVVALLHQYGFNPIFGLYPAPDKKNSRMVITNIAQAGLGMPDRDYYTGTEPHILRIREAYKVFMESVFVIAGKTADEASTIAQQVYRLEEQLALASMTRLERRDPEKTYNKYTTDKLIAEYPQLDFGHYFENIGLGDPVEVNINQTAYLKEVGELLSGEPIEHWKHYLQWQVLVGLAPYLHQTLADAHFGFYGRTLSGKEEQRPRWKRMIDASNSALGEAIGKRYVAQYFPPESKGRMLQLVENLRAGFRNRIGQLDWMSDTTKQKALVKLDRIRVKIGYPEKWRDYSLLLVTNSLASNVLEAGKHNFAYQCSKINKPVDPDEWHMYPQTVNAYYSPTQNEIVFPAAILQPPFFYPKGDDAINYGAIGVVIGHEMTHGFDDQGRKYDADGNLNDWWTAADAQRFEALTKKLVIQYNAYPVTDSVMANGELTLGENIADLGGLSIAFDAWQLASDESTPIDGFTPVQRFYLAYARVWAQNIRPEEMLRRTKEDVHSLGKLRVNGPLVNIENFYQAFDIAPSDSLFLSPEKRARIW